LKPTGNPDASSVVGICDIELPVLRLNISEDSFDDQLIP